MYHVPVSINAVIKYFDVISNYTNVILTRYTDSHGTKLLSFYILRHNYFVSERAEP